MAAAVVLMAVSERSSNTTKIETAISRGIGQAPKRSERSSNTTKIETHCKDKKPMATPQSERSSNTTKIETRTCAVCRLPKPSQKEVLTQQRLKLSCCYDKIAWLKSERSSNTTKIETHAQCMDYCVKK